MSRTCYAARLYIVGRMYIFLPARGKASAYVRPRQSAYLFSPVTNTGAALSRCGKSAGAAGADGVNTRNGVSQRKLYRQACLFEINDLSDRVHSGFRPVGQSRARIGVAEVKIIQYRHVRVPDCLGQDSFILVVIALVLRFADEDAADCFKHAAGLQRTELFPEKLRRGLFFTGFYEKKLAAPLVLFGEKPVPRADFPLVGVAVRDKNIVYALKAAAEQLAASKNESAPPNFS